MRTAAERLVALAEEHVGVPYVWSGGPEAYECGALVRACAGNGNSTTVVAAGGNGGGQAWPNGTVYAATTGEVPPDPWEPALVTVPNVEICEVGERWETSTGVFDFTPEDLVACITSQEDPAVRTPVIKLGHTDPRFDGQPSLGRIENMRLDNNGMTLVGDYVGVPLWLAKIMGSAYPRRSIEGAFEVSTRTGNTWDMVLTGVALLGDAYPAVDTLEDIKALWGSSTPPLYPVEDVQEIAASTDGRFRARKVADDMPKWLHRGNGGEVAAAARSVRASVNLDTVRRAYYETLDSGQYWWWIREIRVNPLQLVVDDDDGSLYLVDVTVATDDTLTFGEPVEVKVEYVAAGAGRKAGQLVAATFGTRVEAGRPARDAPASAAAPESAPPATPPAPQSADGSDGNGGPGSMTPEQLAALGLPATATDEEALAAITALSQRAETAPAPGGGEGDTPAAPATPETPGTTTTPAPGTEGNPASQPETPATSPGGQPATAPATPAATPAAPEGVTIPDGMALVDQAAWQEVQQEIAAGRADRQATAARERDAFLETAIRAGKFPRGRRDHYLTAWAADPAGTREAITKMSPGLFPVEEKGHVSASAEDGADPAAEGPAYPPSWNKSIAAAQKGIGARVKVVQD